MAGNVWEWTSSKWGKDWVKPEFVYPYDPEDGRENPQGNAHRVLRGDAFNGSVDHVRCAYRLRNPPDDRSNDFGFRVVVVVSPFTSGL
jgi:iron(II)-dependent oxidoreductase